MIVEFILKGVCDSILAYYIKYCDEKVEDGNVFRN